MELRQTYQVGFSPDDLTNRLRKAVDPETWLAPWWDGGSRPYIGSVDRGSFRIQIRRGYQNSFAPVLFGRVEAHSGGSLVHVRLGLHPIVGPFMLLWLVAAAVLQGVFALASLAGEGSNIKGLLVLAPTGLAIFGTVLLYFGKWLGRSEESRLLAFADQLWGPPISSP